MNNETILKEIFIKGQRKINIGVKVHGALKIEMNLEATNLGISLCEYSEKILINRNTVNTGNLKAEGGWKNVILVLLVCGTVGFIVFKVSAKKKIISKPSVQKDDNDKN